MIRSTAILLLSLFVAGCSNVNEYKIPPTKVEAVYFHERGNYSVALRIGDEIQIKPARAGRAPVRIVLDAEDHMWYECDATWDNFYGTSTGECVIHIRDVGDISTAGWNHGKFGSGNTTRIQ